MKFVGSISNANLIDIGDLVIRKSSSKAPESVRIVVKTSSICDSPIILISMAGIESSRYDSLESLRDSNEFVIVAKSQDVSITNI